jgi:hypothetical protein
VSPLRDTLQCSKNSRFAKKKEVLGYLFCFFTEHRGFLIWLQENLLLPQLWKMLRCDFAQVGQMAVPLLIHAITLPMGDEVFWNTMNREFSDERWLVRFKTGLENFVQLGKFVQEYSIFNTKKVLKFI